MEWLIENARDFFDFGERAFKEGKYVVAVANYFKSLIAIVDYTIFKEIGILPKNHEQRFSILLHRFPDLYSIVNRCYEPYRRAYRERLKRESVLEVREAVIDAWKRLGLFERLSE